MLKRSDCCTQVTPGSTSRLSTASAPAWRLDQLHQAPSGVEGVIPEGLQDQGFRSHAVHVPRQVVRTHETGTEEGGSGSPPGFHRQAQMGLRKEFQHVVVDGVNDAAGRGEQRQHVGVPATLVAGVRMGALGEQQADGIGAPVLRGQHQRRAPILVFGFELRSRFQEGFARDRCRPFSPRPANLPAEPRPGKRSDRRNRTVRDTTDQT